MNLNYLEAEKKKKLVQSAALLLFSNVFFSSGHNDSFVFLGMHS